jgi:5-oxoprolinase (ATP-hydrolysing) subunit A
MSGDQKSSYYSTESPSWEGLEAAVDLNCDMGEGIGHDEAIMPYISSANIACGYHAGDEATMRQTVKLAAACRVAVGAHVSFLDKENFGRTEMHVPAGEIYHLVTEQLVILCRIAGSLAIPVRHVKPHGALYNQAARDILMAKEIAQAVKDFDARLVLFGLSGSHSIHEAKAIGLKTASEAFADRMYRDDGTLAPRSQPYALIEDTDKAVQQVVQVVREGMITTVSGKEIPVFAETICIHGDGKNAAALAVAIHHTLKQYHIEIKAC